MLVALRNKSFEQLSELHQLARSKDKKSIAGNFDNTARKSLHSVVVSLRFVCFLGNLFKFSGSLKFPKFLIYKF